MQGKGRGEGGTRGLGLVWKNMKAYLILEALYKLHCSITCYHLSLSRLISYNFLTICLNFIGNKILLGAYYWM